MILTFLVFVAGFIVLYYQLDASEKRVMELEKRCAQYEVAYITLWKQRMAGMRHDKPISKVYWAYPEREGPWGSLMVHLFPEPQMYDSAKYEEIQIIRYE